MNGANRHVRGSFQPKRYEEIARSVRQMRLQSTGALAYSFQLTREVWVLSRSDRESAFGEKKIRCVLAHKHVLLRQGLRRLLEDEPDLVVVGEAGNISEAVAITVEHRPDVVISDSGDFGRTLEQLIMSEVPQSRIVSLAAPDNESNRAEARSGEIRDATHQTSIQELIGMLRKVHLAESLVVREMPLRTPREWPVPEAYQRKRTLTAREREVLKLLAEGRTVRTVAKILGLSVKTVDAHKFNLMRKLGIHNKTELVLWAIQRRIVKLPANF
jgi:two-component system response regulator NreC